jgi:uncharacterized repeat protein (TIGR03803 family)
MPVFVLDFATFPPYPWVAFLSIPLLNPEQRMFAKNGVLILLFAGMIVVLPIASHAASGKVLYQFQGGVSGQQPFGEPVIDAHGNLFGKGLVSDGDIGCLPYYCEMVWELSPGKDGSWTYQVLYIFPPPTYATGSLALDAEGNVYGTTSAGGDYGQGMAFELTKSAGGGWVENALYSFGDGSSDGTVPGTMVFDSLGNLFGTTFSGGSSDTGTVFELTPNGSRGWAESVVYSFGAPPDGSGPRGPLTFDSAGNLYGTTNGGGYGGSGDCYINRFDGCGTVFELVSNGEGAWTEEILYAFKGAPQDGQWPYTGVIFDAEGNLFGTTADGGCEAIFCGTAFELSPTQGGNWGETIIKRFSGNNGTSPSNLAFSPSGDLYGAASTGGTSYYYGLIFQLKRVSGEDILYDFTGGSDGGEPDAVAFDDAGHLFGTTSYGGNGVGTAGDGVIFEGGR